MVKTRLGSWEGLGWAEPIFGKPGISQLGSRNGPTTFCKMNFGLWALLPNLLCSLLCAAACVGFVTALPWHALRGTAMLSPPPRPAGL